MAPNKQKVVASRWPGRKSGRPSKSQSATPAPAPATATRPKLKLRLNFNSSAHQGSQPPVSAYQFPLSAPPSDDTPKKEDAEDDTLSGVDEQGRRRGARKRTKVQQPDMVFGSEMDNLITSSATIGKVEDEDDVPMASSPLAIISMRAPARHESPETVRGAKSPPPRYASPNSQQVYRILTTLQSSAEIQVDLPNMSAPGGNGVVEPYTATLLTELYTQCYENQLWHFCDLVADTWIRALQQANKRTQKSRNVQDHMWRKNVALEKKLKEKKKGFKKDVFEFGLDVEDPEMASDTTDINPERLRDLVFGPEELFFDVMCTSLRMVGRKLTLKIEETYEGAWCRYHEHGKHGLPCYRELAWQQKKSRGEEDDGDAVGEETVVHGARGEKRTREAVGADEQRDVKRVRFDADDAGEVIDFGDIDAEGESEEEG